MPKDPRKVRAQAGTNERQARQMTELEQNDEWLLQCHYMQIEGMAELTPPLLETEPGKLPPTAT